MPGIAALGKLFFEKFHSPTQRLFAAPRVCPSLASRRENNLAQIEAGERASRRGH